MTVLTLLYQSLLASIGLTIVWAAYSIFNSLDSVRRRRAAQVQYGCGPLFQPTPWDFSGFYGLYKAMTAAGEHRLLQYWEDNYKKWGPTHGSIRRGKVLITTKEPENFKAVLATKFDDWAVSPLRTGFQPLLGKGIFTMDGGFWMHSRGVLRPQFEKTQVAAVDHLEPHFQKLLGHIPTDGTTVDLQYLFHSLTMDTSSEFLTGVSTDLLDKEKHNELGHKFVASFEAAVTDGILRMRLGWLYWLVPRFQASKNIQTARAAVDHWVNNAMEYKKAVSTGERKAKDGSYVFLNELAADETVDAVRIRNEILNILLAGRDTTASLLSGLFFLLARHQDVFHKLHDEVSQLNGDLPTYDGLRNMKYLQNCIQETLRVLPPVAGLGKQAIRDTILPTGGGSDRKSPIFVPKGGIVFYNFRSSMRDEGVYGADAAEFRPKRWADPSLRPGWSFVPFNGGPRTCLGRMYAQSECAYITVRLLQTFSKLENRDDKPWTEKLTATCCSYYGTQVALYK